MGKTYIFGHRNPDTDTITSSLVMANFEKALGNEDAVACRLGNINKETEYVLNYLGIEAPELIDGVEDGSNVILVDHNSPKESIENLENVNILKVVDHHKLALETSYPLFYRAEPVGCTETVMYKLYKENNIEVDKTIATLMLSAIISDTLLFRSPTCTPLDKIVAEALAKIADVNLEELAMEMFNAGSNLKGKSAEEICFQDFKQFTVGEKVFGVGQISSMNVEELQEVNEVLTPYLSVVLKENKLNMVYFMLTNILDESTELLCVGQDAKAPIIDAYGVPEDAQKVILKGVVSRKKQLVPTLISALKH